MSKRNRTVRRLSKLGLGKGILITHQSSVIYMPSSIGDAVMPEDTAVESMSSRLDFLVSRFRRQESDLAKRTAGTSGLKQSAAFALFDHDSRSWRTPQLSLLKSISEPYSETWPKRGMMRSGACWERTMLVPRIKGRESGYWPTPTVDGNYNRKGLSATSGDGLATAVKKWPTPQARDCKGPSGFKRRRESDLCGEVEKYPTPRSSDAKRGNSPSERRRNDPCLASIVHGGTSIRQTWGTPTAQIAEKCGGRHRGRADTLASQIAEREGLNQMSTGQLNPEWEEWLMGWPIGATGLQPLEKDRFQRWWRLHGGCCRRD